MDRKTRARGGRTSKGPRDAVMSRMSKGVKPRLEALARARDTTVSDLVAEVIEGWLPQAEQEEGIVQSHQDVLDFDLKTG